MEAIIPAGQIKTVTQRPTAFFASRYAAAANNGGGIAKADGLASSFFVSTVVSPLLRFLLSFPQAWENMSLSAEKTGEI